MQDLKLRDLKLQDLKMQDQRRLIATRTTVDNAQYIAKHNKIAWIITNLPTPEG